jgi:hypothetical protein
MCWRILSSAIFLLVFDGRADERWTVFVDNHTFTLFWAPVARLPEIVHPQDEWLEFLRKEQIF